MTDPTTTTPPAADCSVSSSRNSAGPLPAIDKQTAHAGLTALALLTMMSFVGYIFFHLPDPSTAGLAALLTCIFLGCCQALSRIADSFPDRADDSEAASTS
jgi:hypothetical protein